MPGKRTSYPEETVALLAFQENMSHFLPCSLPAPCTPLLRYLFHCVVMIRLWVCLPPTACEFLKEGAGSLLSLQRRQCIGWYEKGADWGGRVRGCSQAGCAGGVSPQPPLSGCFLSCLQMGIKGTISGSPPQGEPSRLDKQKPQVQRRWRENCGSSRQQIRHLKPSAVAFGD